MATTRLWALVAKPKRWAKWRCLLAWGGINGIVKYTVVDSPGVPPLTPVSLLRQVGAVIDLNNNTMELKKIGTTTALRILSTGHVAHKLTEFASGGWKAPTPEQTKLFQARSHVFRPVTLPGEFKQATRSDWISQVVLLIRSQIILTCLRVQTPVPVILVVMTNRPVTALPVLY